jgi:hypothetical protein
VRWQIATAVAAHVLGVDPFDRPDVAETSAGTARLLTDPARRGAGPATTVALDAPDLAATLWRALGHGGARRYVAVTAYVAPNARRTKLMTELRVRIRKAFGIATTGGYGPRALHATAQLHADGPAAVMVLQLTADDPVDVPIPGAGYSFGTFKSAQANADAEVLAARGRVVVRVHLGRNVEQGLERVCAALARRPKPRHTSRRVAHEPVRARRR